MLHKGVNINTSNAHELFPQQNDIETMDALMIQEQHYDQHKLKNHQHVKTNTNGGDRLFPQQSVVEPSYFLMTQYRAHELLRQQNDTEPSDALTT